MEQYLDQYFLTDFTQLQGEVRQRNQLWRRLQDLSHAAQILYDQLQADLARCPDADDALIAAHAALRVALDQAQATLDAVSH